MVNYQVERKLEHVNALRAYASLYRKQVVPDADVNRRIAAEQTRRINALMRSAWDIPFYRERFKESGTTPDDFYCAEDLHRFPLLTKDELRAWVNKELEDNPARYERWHVAPTSGSTGQPLKMLFSPREQAWATANWLRTMNTAGYNPFLGKAMSRPNVLHGATGGGDSPIQKLGILRRGFISNTNDTHLDTQVIVDEINAYEPDYLYIHRYLMVRIAKYVKETGAYLRRPQFYTPIGEMVDEPSRKILSEVFGPGLVDSYGLAETGSCVVKFPGRDIYQVHSDTFVVNICGEDPSMPAERGMAVITPLYKREFPLINYASYDTMDTFVDECGLRFVRSINGRMNDMVRHRDGRISVSEHFMTVLNFMTEVVAWRAIQEDFEHITMLLVRNPDVSESRQDELAEQIVAGLARSLDDPSMIVDCEWVDDIPADASGKLRLVVCKLPPE